MCTRHDGLTGGLIWGTSFLKEYVELLSNAARLLDADTDVSFFVNKRDFPNVRIDGADPYGMTFFANVAPMRLIRKVIEARDLLPVCSGYTGALFADVPFPLIQDYIGPQPRNETKEEFESRWDSRLSCAVFRGSATGCGTTRSNNPRLALVSNFGPGTQAAASGLFDVKITGRNKRLRKHPEESYLKVLPPAHNEKHNWMTMEEQVKYRFAIYVEGHSAASRLGRLMREGFVILAVKTWVAPADELFFSRWLQNYHHLVWCTMDELPSILDYFVNTETGRRRAKEIAWNAVQFHKENLTTQAIQQYVANIMHDFANRSDEETMTS